MRKALFIGFAVLMLALILVMSVALAETPEAVIKPPEKPKPELTSEQIEEVRQIYNQIWELKKQLVKKYQSYGILEQEKAGRILERMDKMHKRFDEKGYVPMFDKKFRKKKRNCCPE